MSNLTIHLTPQMLAKINEIGRKRSPNEACGIIIPVPRDGGGSDSQVIELPNRSLQVGGYKIATEDIKIELGSDLSDRIFVEAIATWHTHPNGAIGPGPEDLQKKHDGLNYLVVALLEDGSAVPCWF